MPPVYRSAALPILVRPDGTIDHHLLLWLNGVSSLSPLTIKRYFLSLSRFADFLWLSSHECSLLEATAADLKSFKAARTEVISNSSWNADLAGLISFYDWATEEELIAASPVKRSLSRRGWSQHGNQPSAVLKARYARRSRVKWLTPAAVERFITVGMLGLGADGLPVSSDRLEVPVRNAAYARLLYASGMRNGEASGLLELELPRDHKRGWVPEALAKHRSSRYFYLEPAARAELRKFVLTERAIVVQGAAERGVYERELKSGNMTLISAVDQQNGVARRVKFDGKFKDLDRLTWDQRRELLIERDGVLEPAALWLSRYGMPLSPTRWNPLFEEASARCEARGVPHLSATPHSMRHSFALRMAIDAQGSYLERGLTPDEKIRFQAVFGDVWEILRTLLGHVNVETTKSIYLEPLRGIDLDGFLLEVEGASSSEIFTELSNLDQRIGDDPL
jgi:integrase